MGTLSDFRRFSVILAIVLCYIAFIMLRYVPSICSLIKGFIMKGHGLCQRPSLRLLMTQ